MLIWPSQNVTQRTHQTLSPTSPSCRIFCGGRYGLACRLQLKCFPKRRVRAVATDFGHVVSFGESHIKGMSVAVIAAIPLVVGSPNAALTATKEEALRCGAIQKPSSGGTVSRL